MCKPIYTRENKKDVIKKSDFTLKYIFAEFYPASFCLMFHGIRVLGKRLICSNRFRTKNVIPTIFNQFP